jgi:hypothetical protein
VGPHILWAGLELLGPEDDVEEKENEEGKKIPSCPFLFLLLGSPRSRYPLLVP